VRRCYLTVGVGVAVGVGIGIVVGIGISVGISVGIVVTFVRFGISVAFCIDIGVSGVVA
jgi:hypothetical protein